MTVVSTCASVSPLLNGHLNSLDSRDRDKCTAKNNSVCLTESRRRVKQYWFCVIQMGLCNSVSIASFLSLWPNKLSEGYCLTWYLHPSECTELFNPVIQNRIVTICKTTSLLFDQPSSRTCFSCITS